MHEKETNYAIHTESTNCDPEKRHTRCQTKNTVTDRGQERSREEKMSLKTGMRRSNGGGSTESKRKRIPNSWSSKKEGSTSLARFKEK